ncbi:hypothetical protein EAH89_28340 [Roseomonas nepalensis]|uniref:DUF4433 domain-containing protein n=1 Tax=Muricoccus nepalensis TaxID=1854500 RepID=A0A502EXR9_9PROT|nr:hypothetical protein [Roseomonas nepalensis]TPG41912.1 hypothetical protein EAH89_28340 [Roseomonas nepalensis]
MDFARHNPRLFHVTHRTAIEGIRAHGLLPAAALATGAEATANRDAWTPAPAPGGTTAWLRWQNMPEGPIAARLHPAIPPAAWRLFINSMVFLFASEADARRLAASPRDAGEDQAVLRFETAALLEAGCALLTCRWNNGYLDRAPAARRRLRAYDDYRPAALWRRGEPLGEITAFGGIPAGIPFDEP